MPLVSHLDVLVLKAIQALMILVAPAVIVALVVIVTLVVIVALGLKRLSDSNACKVAVEADAIYHLQS